MGNRQQGGGAVTIPVGIPGPATAIVLVLDFLLNP